MTKKRTQEKNRFFILTVKKEKSQELKKEIISYKHNFQELTEFSKLYGGNFVFYQVCFKNSSEKNALCDFCDYLNGFRDSAN